MAGGPRRRFVTLGAAIIAVPVVAASIVIVGLLLFVVWMSLARTDAGVATGAYGLDNYIALFADPLVARAAGNTFAFAGLAVIVAGAFGLPLAWLAERTDLPGRSVIAPALTLGLLLPGFFTAMGWIFLLHPRIGFVNQWLREAFGLAQAPLPITTIGGMGWIEGLTLAPLFFFMTASGFRAMDPSLEEAARTAGASHLAVLRRIGIPLMMPGILAAAIFTFTLSIGTFDVPGVVGLASRIFTFSTLLYVKISAVDDLPNYGLPASFGTVILVLALVLSLAYVRLLRRSRQYQVITGKAYRPRPIPLGRWAALGWIIAGLYIVMALLLPLLLVLWSSLLPYYAPPSWAALHAVSLATFARVPWPLVLRGLRNSVILALVTPTLALGFSVAFSWLILRSRMRGRALLDEIAFLPQAIPGIIFSLGAVVVALFVMPDAVPLYGSVAILALVYTVGWISFGTRVVNAALIQVHSELEEAAYVAGSGRLATARLILLPLISPALVSGWVWLALLSIRELTRAVILVTGDNVTLPIVTWSLWNGGQFNEACVVILTTIALFAPLLLLYFYLARRAGAAVEPQVGREGSMRRMAAWIGLGVGVALAAGSPARAAEVSPALQQVIDGAKKEGAVTLSYGGGLLGGSEGAATLQKLINQRYGTNLSITYTPGPSAPEMAARLAQEQAARRPSSTDLYPVSMTAANAKLFLAIDWRDLVPDLPAEAMKFDKHGVAYATLLVGMTYNTGLIPEDKAPKSLKDLLDPQWKGKIGVRISTTFMAFLALPQVMGPAGAVDFFRKLGTQASGMIRCGNAERIASGEFPIFYPNCGDYEARTAARDGAKVGAIIPSDAACMTYFTAGIPNNSAHPNATKLLIAFLLSREGQDFEWNADGTDYHGLPGSKIAAVMAKYRASGVTFIDEVDVEEQHPELLQVQKDMLQALQESVQK